MSTSWSGGCGRNVCVSPCPSPQKGKALSDVFKHHLDFELSLSSSLLLILPPAVGSLPPSWSGFASVLVLPGPEAAAGLVPN